ncbi:MAG: hypothetical protein M5U35_13545 [Roseovarius sp.]|nr:hypothetical protein [Roseovarius sp.]
MAALVLPPLLAFFLGLIIVRIPGVAFAMLTLAVGRGVLRVCPQGTPYHGRG